MNSSEEKVESVEVSSADVPCDLNQFLLECEKDFSNRYTEEDEEFSSVLNREPPSPPIVCPWYCKPPNYSHGRGGGHRGYKQRNQYDHGNNYGSRNHYGERSESHHRSEYKRLDHRDGRYRNRHSPY